jgi:hypothetical protein
MVLLGLLFGAAASLPRAAGDPPTTVLVHVEADRNGVPDLDRSQAEMAVGIALTRARCAVALADPAGPPAGLELRVRLELWRETEEPGGEPVFDPLTGTYRTGVLHKVETRFETGVLAPGRETPLVRRSYRFVQSSGTTRVSAYDPREDARRRAFDRIADESATLLCKEVRKLRRGKH